MSRNIAATQHPPPPLQPRQQALIYQNIIYSRAFVRIAAVRRLVPARKSILGMRATVGEGVYHAVLLRDRREPGGDFRGGTGTADVTHVVVRYGHARGSAQLLQHADFDAAFVSMTTPIPPAPPVQRRHLSCFVLAREFPANFDGSTGRCGFHSQKPTAPWTSGRGD